MYSPASPMEQPVVSNAISSVAAGLESPESVVLHGSFKASGIASSKIQFSCDRDELRRYLDAVDELVQSVAFSSTVSGSRKLALDAAMLRLEDEFRRILLSHTSVVKTELVLSLADEGGTTTDSWSGSLSSYSDEGNSNANTPRARKTDAALMPDDDIQDLRSIAERMIAAGYSSRCVNVYSSMRKCGVEQSLKKLGIERQSSKSVQRLEWKVQEEKIQRWIRAFRICIRVLFLGEKKLCEHIFEGIGDKINHEVCFMDTIEDSALQLLNFAEAISSGRRSPEKLFKILDLHEVLSDLLPEIEIIFGSKSFESIRVLVTRILEGLAEAARGTFSEFENAVLGELTEVPIPGGSIHPMTIYVMNYVTKMVEDYVRILDKLISSKPSFTDGPKNHLDFDIHISKFEGKASTLGLHVIWIVGTLTFKLRGKSKQYKDVPLAHLFTMNNLRHILQKINETPEIADMMGCELLEKLKDDYSSAADSYLRSSWKPILDCLEYNKMATSLFCGLSKHCTRRRLKTFNANFEEVLRTQLTWSVPDAQHFEEVLRTQLTWSVPDAELRTELRSTISSNLTVAYQMFLEQFGSYVENDIKYSVEELEKVAMDLFKDE